MLTMLLGGLWHGAAWNFVLWGGLHGLLLVAERRWGAAEGGGVGRVPLLARQALVFQAVVFCWMIFRSECLGDLAQLVFTLGAGDPAPALLLGQAAAVAIVAAGWAFQLVALRWDPDARFLRLPLPARAACYAGAALAVMVFSSQAPKSFIYFQF